MRDETVAHTSEWRDVALRWLRRATKLVLVAAALAAVIFWFLYAPVRVTHHRIERGVMASEVMGTGTLEARVQATISPKIAGRVEKVSVDQGDRVSAGQPLVRLDDAELRQQVAIAEASLAASRAAVERIETDRERTAAVLDQARKEHDRVQTLASRDAATRQSLDRAAEALAVAQAGLAQSDASIAEAEKEVVAAEKTLEYHRARLDDTRIAAPFEGLIVARHRESGDVVVPGSPVLTLISTEELWVSAWVDETAIDELAPGQLARVVFRSEPDRHYSGSVTRIGREIDRETREFIVEVRVLELPKNWAVGQRAEVYIETGQTEKAVLIPAQAVVWQEGEPGVYVDSGGRAAWRPIELGLRNREIVEAVQGVGPGEVVVTPVDPKARLADGRRIDGR